VDVEVAGSVGVARHVMAVTAVAPRSGRHNILEAPDLEQRGEQEALRVGPKRHGAGEIPLMEGDTLLFIDADEIEPAALIGGKGKAHIVAQ
jgi:hypothetical protein